MDDQLILRRDRRQSNADGGEAAEHDLPAEKKLLLRGEPGGEQINIRFFNFCLKIQNSRTLRRNSEFACLTVEAFSRKEFKFFSNQLVHNHAFAGTAQIRRRQFENGISTFYFLAGEFKMLTDIS